MKRQIRRGVFETNSSSMHAICISKTMPDVSSLPAKVSFEHENFGWCFDIYADTYSKAAYLYQAICDLYANQSDIFAEKCEQLRTLLQKHGVDCVFASTDADYGYIDHAGYTKDFVEAVLNDENKLLAYLFGNSFVVVGNDNTDDFVDYMYGGHDNEALLPKFDAYEIFLKGN